MAISLSERAAQRVKEIATQHKIEGTPHLRVAVKGGGCSGFTYVLDLCAGPAEGDEIFQAQDIQIVCDPKSYLYLNGTTVDFNDNLMGGGFTFDNPNAKGSLRLRGEFQSLRWHRLSACD